MCLEVPADKMSDEKCFLEQQQAEFLQAQEDTWGIYKTIM